MSAYDLGSPLGRIIDMSTNPEGYRDWVEETREGVAVECGAQAMKSACDDPELQDLLGVNEGEGCL